MSRLTRTPEYRVWAAMKQRCLNERAQGYPGYGGRGIEVCAGWRASFADFMADMGPRPAGGSLDRIDVNGHYEPGNCRWATVGEQANNKRCHVEPTRHGTHQGYETRGCRCVECRAWWAAEMRAKRARWKEPLR